MRLIAPVPCLTSNYLVSLGLIADWLQVGHLRVGGHTQCAHSRLCSCKVLSRGNSVSVHLCSHPVPLVLLLSAPPYTPATFWTPCSDPEDPWDLFLPPSLPSLPHKLFSIASGLKLHGADPTAQMSKAQDKLWSWGWGLRHWGWGCRRAWRSELGPWKTPEGGRIEREASEQAGRPPGAGD